MQNTLIQTHLTKYSKQLYEKLERDGHDIGIDMFITIKSLSSVCSFLGYAEKGSVWVAQTSDRLHTLKRPYATIKPLGNNNNNRLSIYNSIAKEKYLC